VQQRDDAVESVLYLGRWRGFTRGGKPIEHPRPRLGLTPLGELHPDDAALAPRDAAFADCRIE